MFLCSLAGFLCHQGCFSTIDPGFAGVRAFFFFCFFVCSDSSESSESSGGPRSAHNDKVRPARPGWGWMLLSLDFRILTNEVDKASVRKLERVSCFFPNAWCFFFGDFWRAIPL
jgi:hypothetical protein